jgi:hypothetical protein
VHFAFKESKTHVTGPSVYLLLSRISLSLSLLNFLFFFFFFFFFRDVPVAFVLDIYIYILVKNKVMESCYLLVMVLIEEAWGELLLASYGIDWRGLKLITLILLRASIITSQREKLCRCIKNKNTEKDLNLSIYLQVLDRILCTLCLLFLVMIIMATKQNV